MRNTSELYKTLRGELDTKYEVRVIQGEKTYGTDALKSVKVFFALFDGDGPQIGQTYSAQCEITMIESSANWPRMAEFEVQLRLVSEDGSEQSEWLSMGTYHTDERSEDKYGNLSIVAFDGMLLTEQYWTDKIAESDLPTEWPITSKAWADLVASAGLIEFDSRVVLDDTVALIGLDTTSTIRDNLKTIAAAHGGNWTITPEGKLRLIPFVNLAPGRAAIAGIAIAGIAVVGSTSGQSENVIGSTVLGLNIKSFESSPELEQITGVSLETATGNTATAGTDDGYVLSGSCEFADSAGVGELCLKNVKEYIYRPFNATGALLDPAAEIGDAVVIDGETYQMMNIDWTLNTWPTASIGAAFEEEVDHEYTYQDEAAKTLKKALRANQELERRVYSSIEQTEASIIQTVGETYATKGEVNDVSERTEASVTLLKDEFTVELERVEKVGDDRYEEQQTYLRYADGTLTLGKKGDASSLRQSNQGQGLYINEEVQYFVNQDEMLTPKKFRIPLGGSLQLGDFIFQPRTSGNMSLLWVGE